MIWWNWKSAALSSLVRSTLFFVSNLSAGVEAARAAFVIELLFRGVTSGFYGALTQAFRAVRPVWAGAVGAMVLLPLTGHLLEFAVHWLSGTARLTASIAVSVAFTVVSTAFNLFAMRRGALIVGSGSNSIWDDLRRAPGLVVAFATAPCGMLRRFVRSAIGL